MGGAKASTQIMTYYAGCGVKDASDRHDGSAAITLYDPAGNIVLEMDCGGRKTWYIYDAAGNALSITDLRGNTTNYQYDALHRLTSVSYPNLTGNGPHSATQYVYDGGGRRLFRRDDWGVARYGYDSLGRLTRAISPLENSAFGYDADGDRTSVTSSLGTVAYAYDADNRLTTVTDPLGNTTTYTYDNYGHVSQVALPAGVRRTTTYHGLSGGAVTNRPKTVENRSADGAINYWSGTYKYDYPGNIVQTDVSWNKTPATYTLSAGYDSLYRLLCWTDTSISNTNLQLTWYQYDADGNRTAWGNQNNANVLSYISPAYTQVTMNASYDAANRMTAQSTALPGNWYQLTPGGRTSNITHEPNGNTSEERYWYTGSTEVFDAIMTYAYDDANHLMQYVGELHDSSWGWLNREYYTYDGDGRRRDWEATVTFPYPPPPPPGGAGTTCSYKKYEYAGNDVVAEWSKNGNTVVWYVLDLGGEKLYTLHWKDQSLVPSVYVKDLQGSVREVIRYNGVTENWYQYDAFGQPTSQSVSLANSYQFASAPLDTVYPSSSAGYTAFYNLGARLYNPRVGRFLTQDTYRGNPWSPWTQNLYAYAGNNPASYTDPTGHVAWAVIGAVAGAISGAVSAAYETYRQAGAVDWGEVFSRGAEWAFVGSGVGELAAVAALSVGSALTTAGVKTGAAVSAAGAAGVGIKAVSTAGSATEANESGTETVRAYRYVNEAELNLIRKTGKIPNTRATGRPKDVFVSPNRYDTVVEAENALRIGRRNPLGPTDPPTYRVEFDMDSAIYRYGGNVEGGCGIELITEDPIPVDLRSIFQLK